MHCKKVAVILIPLLLFHGLLIPTCTCTPILSLSDGNIAVYLVYPEEAHPDTAITHNISLVSSQNTILNLTLFVYAEVNSTLQESTQLILRNRVLHENTSFVEEILFMLPENANGTLYCEITVETNQSSTYSFYKFYTTRVSELTFGEMQLLYQEMLENYTLLQADFATLLEEYNGLLADYENLFANYTALLDEHNILLTEYSDKTKAYNDLLSAHEELSNNYSSESEKYTAEREKSKDWQDRYEELNATHNNLQTNFTSLKSDANELYSALTLLNDTYLAAQEDLKQLNQELTADKIVMFVSVTAVALLIALVVYIKRKEKEPYVVIRKETVAMRPDEKS